MSALINITPLQPISASIVTTGDTRQNLWDAVDISAYDLLDLELVIFALTGPASVTIGLVTGLQTQSDNGVMDGWIAPTGLQFTAAGAGSAQLKTFGPTSNPASSGFLRYARWIVLSAASTGNVAFTLRGMGRKIGAG